MKKKAVLILTVFLSCFACIKTPVHAQQIPLSKLYIRHITQKDGLLYNQVKCFLQDSRNFMWMGGKALQRYDGYRFKNYFTGEEDIETNSLFEDSYQRVWAGTNKGVYKLNKITDRFELFQDSVLLNGKKSLLLALQILEDKKKNIWFATPFFYARLSAQSSLAEDAAGLLNFSNGSNAGHIYMDMDGKLWFRFPKPYGIVRYDPVSQKLSSHLNNPKQEPVFDMPLGDGIVVHDRDDNIWFTEGFTNRDLIRYNIKEKRLMKYKLNCTNSIKNCQAVPDKILIDSKGAVWVLFAEHYGLARYNKQSDSFDYLYSSENLSDKLTDIYSITNPSDGFYEDRDENFWYGGKGVNFFSPYHQQFQNYTLTEAVMGNGELKNNKPQNTTPNTFLFTKDNKLYVAYYGDGLWQYDYSLQTIKKTKWPNNISQLIWHMFTADSLHIFLANQEKKLICYNTLTNDIHVLTPQQFPQFYINNSYVENRETAWLAHERNGLSVFNPVTYQLKNFQNIFLPDKKENISISDIEPEQNDYLWISPGDRGLQLFDKQKGTIIKAYYPEPEKLVAKNYNHVRNIERLNADTLLLCTDHGFIIFNTNTFTGTHLTTKNGLPDNFCWSSLTEKNKKYTWINTRYRGLCRLNLQLLQITNYQHQDDIENPFGDISNIILPDGRFIFSNSNGFIVFNPEDLAEKITPDNVTVTGITINGQPINTDSVFAVPRQLRLSYMSNSLSFDFSAMDYLKSSKINYYVLLKNADSGWMNLGNQSHIEYRNLAPGSYSLLLKCSDENGAFSKNVTELRFDIIPPYWQRWWFYTLFALFLASAIYILYRYRIKTIRHEAQLKTQYNQLVAETEIKALRSQMNPHFIFNSLNAINRYILKSDREQASAYLTKFSKLIRLILDNSRQAKIPLSHELDALELYLELESLRFQNNFQYSIHIDENLSPSAIFVPPLIIQPFIENAIWHGLLPKGNDCKLKLDFSVLDRKLLCVIEDNGIGRVASEELKKEQSLQKSSIGISTTGQRLKLIANESDTKDSIEIKDLYNETGKPAGTKVIIYIPYSYN